MFTVHYHDHLDHVYELESFVNYNDAYKFYQDCLKSPVELYDHGYELTTDDDEFETIEFDEVQTLEQCRKREMFGSHLN